MQKQCEEKLATVEAKKEAEDAWREHCLDLASKTLAIYTNSWYMGAKFVQSSGKLSSKTADFRLPSIPGKKREYLIYMGELWLRTQHMAFADRCLGGIPAWHEACLDALKDWKGFEVHS